MRAGRLVRRFPAWAVRKARGHTHTMRRLLPLLVILFTASVGLRADLVWTPDKGWEIKGESVLKPLLGSPQEVETALQAMNAAKAEDEQGNEWTALDLYEEITENYPDSLFAPEAHYQRGLIYIRRHQFESAFEEFDRIISRYPDYPRFNAVVGKEFEIATRIKDGERPYLWGIFPWFKNSKKGIEFYEGVVKNAPYSEYAALSLMNIADLARDRDEPEVAIDALDRLINNYPQSMLAPDAYYNLAKTHEELVEGPPYDQGATRDAISNYQDFLLLYPENADAAKAEKSLIFMRDTFSRSKLMLGNFYYLYRNNNRAALIFYNEAITAAPDSESAEEARQMIQQINDGVPAPMTPVDWIFGRYEPEDDLGYSYQTQVDNLESEAFQLESTETFLGTPGAEAVETITPSGVREYEGISPVPAPYAPTPIDDSSLVPVKTPQGAPTQPTGRPLLR